MEYKAGFYWAMYKEGSTRWFIIEYFDTLSEGMKWFFIEGRIQEIEDPAAFLIIGPRLEPPALPAN